MQLNRNHTSSTLTTQSHTTSSIGTSTAQSSASTGTHNIYSVYFPHTRSKFSNKIVSITSGKATNTLDTANTYSPTDSDQIPCNFIYNKPHTDHGDELITTLHKWKQHRLKKSSSGNAALGTNMRSTIEGYTHHIFNLVASIMYNKQPPRKLLTNKSKECEKNVIKPGIMETQNHEATACNLLTVRNAFSHANSLVANQFHTSMDLTNNYKGGYSQTTQFCNGNINAMHITNENSADIDTNNSYHNQTHSTCVAKADDNVYRATACWTQSNNFLIYHLIPSNNLAFNSRI